MYITHTNSHHIHINKTDPPCNFSVNLWSLEPLPSQGNLASQAPTARWGISRRCLSEGSDLEPWEIRFKNPEPTIIGKRFGAKNVRFNRHILA